LESASGCFWSVPFCFTAVARSGVAAEFAQYSFTGAASGPISINDPDLAAGESGQYRMGRKDSGRYAASDQTIYHSIIEIHAILAAFSFGYTV
jgi:hypothetical protein